MTRLKRLAGGPVTCSGTTVAEPTPVGGIDCARAGALAASSATAATTAARHLTMNPLLGCRETLTDQLQLRAASFVARGDTLQYFEHRERGGGAVGVDHGRRVDLADRGLAAERAHDDVVADRAQPELGDQADADAGGDEALH